MAIYAEFFNRKDDTESACGDRAILRLDARVNAWKMHDWAIEWAHKHSFEAYHLIKGESLLTARPITTKQFVEA